MRNTMILAAVLIGFLCLGGAVDAQCKAPNIQLTGQATVAPGKKMVLNYAAPVELEGQYIHSFLGLMGGSTPLGNGYCLALRGSIYYLGCSAVINRQSTFTYQIPGEPSLIGAKLYFAGFSANGTLGKHGASNNIRATIWEDWPLP